MRKQDNPQFLPALNDGVSLRGVIMKSLISDVGLNENFIIIDAKADSNLMKEFHRALEKEREKQKFRESLNVYSQKCLPKPNR